VCRGAGAILESCFQHTFDFETQAAGAAQVQAQRSSSTDTRTCTHGHAHRYTVVSSKDAAALDRWIALKVVRQL